MLFHHKIKLILKNKIPQNLVSEFNFDYTNSIKWGMVRFEYGKLKNIYTIMTIKKIPDKLKSDNVFGAKNILIKWNVIDGDYIFDSFYYNYKFDREYRYDENLNRDGSFYIHYGRRRRMKNKGIRKDKVFCIKYVNDKEYTKYAVSNTSRIKSLKSFPSLFNFLKVNEIIDTEHYNENYPWNYFFKKHDENIIYMSVNNVENKMIKQYGNIYEI
tara:strand:+ start:1527 stop:2168 length:642 start_codon:yes stop_codon:yes gene_type:complete